MRWSMEKRLSNKAVGLLLLELEKGSEKHGMLFRARDQMASDFRLKAALYPHKDAS